MLLKQIMIQRQAAMKGRQGRGAIRKWPQIRPSQTKLSSDQTKMSSKNRVRSKCARNCL